MHLIVKDHFQNPRNLGDLDRPDATATVENPVCGDVLKLDLEIRDGQIVRVRFKAMGCSTAIAASSMLTLMLEGKNWTEALAIRREDVAKKLGGLPSSKIHCSVLAEHAIRAAAKDYLTHHSDPALAKLLE
ncbi:MAG: iron-sulfur cluster assembly scaffold protein [Acidobacteriota bacterium]